MLVPALGESIAFARAIAAVLVFIVVLQPGAQAFPGENPDDCSDGDDGAHEYCCPIGAFQLAGRTKEDWEACIAAVAELTA